MRMPRENANAKPRRKRPTNLSVDATLLERAKALGIKVSGLLEESLRSRIRVEEERAWLEQNRDAIAALNRETHKQGVWSKKLRRF